MHDPVFTAEHIWFSYDDEKNWILKDFSLSLERGKKIAVMGPNGAGKSTFFLCCNGVLKPSRGTVYLDGTPVSYRSKDLLSVRSKVGIVFQDPDNQLFLADVRQEIAFGLLNLKVPREETLHEVGKIIDRLGISDFAGQPVHALSGGQKKLVSIADVLVMHPEMVILDEPFASLDQSHSRMVENCIDQMTEEGITVLLATHDSDYAMQWADEIVGISDGTVVCQKPPEDFFTDGTLLAKLKLHAPNVLTIYRKLTEKGMLNASLPMPRSIEMLSAFLE